MEQQSQGHRQREHRPAAGGHCCHNVAAVVVREECVDVGVLFVRDGSMPIGARLSSHTGLHCAYQLVIRRQALWDLLLIQQGCPGTGPHPVIRRCSAFYTHILLP